MVLVGLLNGAEDLRDGSCARHGVDTVIGSLVGAMLIGIHVTGDRDSGCKEELIVVFIPLYDRLVLVNRSAIAISGIGIASGAADKIVVVGLADGAGDLRDGICLRYGVDAIASRFDASLAVCRDIIGNRDRRCHLNGVIVIGLINGLILSQV